ncbi:hypothetical protein LIER_39164 [Lithospermum erythrorhizon]|uniref:Uncharacterized protein n=1 Tax=Lithospermum erythrorhizon TaxID=34254 RepID=A0AAV3QAR9_LITER
MAKLSLLVAALFIFASTNDWMVPKSIAQGPPGLLDCAMVCVRFIEWCPKRGCDCFEAGFLVGWCFPWTDQANKIQCLSHNDCRGTTSNNNGSSYCIRSIGAHSGVCISSEIVVK